jgi:hypothetical protein
MLHRVKDLSPEQKLAIEALLGRAISDEEAVSVRAVLPAAIVPSPFSPQERSAALRQIDEYFARIDANRKPVRRGNPYGSVAVGASELPAG